MTGLSTKEESTKFQGFPPSLSRNYFKYPTLLEQHWHELSGSEQKILDFVLRQTYGFRKTADAISLSQFEQGIGNNNKGTGLSRAQIQRSLRSLEEKGFIYTSVEGRKTKLIGLVLAAEQEIPDLSPKHSDISAEVRAVIEMFRPIAFHKVDAFLGDEKEIRASQRLLEQYKPKQLEAIVEKVTHFAGIQFAPRVYSPSELHEKLPKVMRVIREQEAQPGGPRWVILNVR